MFTILKVSMVGADFLCAFLAYINQDQEINTLIYKEYYIFYM